MPPPKAGHVRFYHGGPNENGIDGPRWVSPDPVYARDYRGPSQLHYIDLPEHSPLVREMTDVSGTSASKRYAAVEVPEDIARRDMKLVHDYQAQSQQPALRDVQWARETEKRTRGTKVEGIVDWIRRNGGLIDENSEVSHIVGGRRAKAGLINGKRGMTLDDATLRAWEEGFFPGKAERPHFSDLLEAVSQEVNQGRKTVRERDHHLLAEREQALEILEAADADESVADDQDGPAVAQHLQRQVDRHWLAA